MERYRIERKKTIIIKFGPYKINNLTTFKIVFETLVFSREYEVSYKRTGWWSVKKRCVGGSTMPSCGETTMRAGNIC